MNKTEFILFTAGIVLATAFTFSCSSDDSDNENTPPSGTSSSSLGGGSSPSGGGSSSSGGGGKVTTFTDSRDNKTYKSVKIGNQIWMAENLNYAVGGKCYGECYDEGCWVVDDDDVSYILSPIEIQANCDKYGRLYDWSTANTVCPTGWHLPSDAEWGALMQFVNPSCSATTVDCDNASKFLKATSGWDFDGVSGNGTDDYDFSALPGGEGIYISAIEFRDIGERGYWWSATEYDSDNALGRRIRYRDSIVRSDYYEKHDLYSVRCVKDTP